MHYLLMCKSSKVACSLWKQESCKLLVVIIAVPYNLHRIQRHRCQRMQLIVIPLGGCKEHLIFFAVLCPLAIHIPCTQEPRKTQKHDKTFLTKCTAFFFNNEELFVLYFSLLGLCFSSVLDYIETTVSFQQFK